MRSAAEPQTIARGSQPSQPVEDVFGELTDRFVVRDGEVLDACPVFWATQVAASRRSSSSDRSRMAGARMKKPTPAARVVAHDGGEILQHHGVNRPPLDSTSPA